MVEVAKVGRMAEWPSWTPTADIKKRIQAGLPQRRPAEPDGCPCDLSLSLRRQQGHALPHPPHQSAGIHRPGDLIGLHPPHQQDVIDLYNRAKQGTVVVVLAPHQGDSPINPRMANANIFN
jgi:hypothetical protein